MFISDTWVDDLFIIAGAVYNVQPSADANTATDWKPALTVSNCQAEVALVIALSPF